MTDENIIEKLSRRPEKRLYIIRIDRGYARIIGFNVSETGEEDSYKEELLVSSNFSGVVALKDVSETGNHRCKLFVFDRGIPTKTVGPENDYWQTKCPICAVIQKNEGE